MDSIADSLTGAPRDADPRAGLFDVTAASNIAWQRRGVWTAPEGKRAVEISQVRYFLAVAKELNFTRAAEQCNVTQPALSRAIKLLEDE
ncbi:LysR family transcriptional regulator, partial [Mesorhizobium sp. M3A.F.Ca.ET.201.01.1.1]